MNRYARSARAVASVLVFAMAALACSPKFDWREVRPEGSGLRALFPCKPTVESRIGPPEGAAPKLAMGLAVCRVDALSVSVSWADVGEPAQVGPALLQMRESLLGKLQARSEGSRSVAVMGMTPNDQSLQQGFMAPAGAAPASQGAIAVFARGLRVYQLVMLGARPGAEASQTWEALLGSIKLEP
ncbi:hypothetical protein [Roseateles sp.]|uniref:hypothetical protein n=1 Tax=Roseateles sp. TaxID=1971397 RepID=UPI0037CC4935